MKKPWVVPELVTMNIVNGNPIFTFETTFGTATS